MSVPDNFSLESIVAAVQYHLPDRTVSQVEDRGVWIRRSFRITLDDGAALYLKLDGSFQASEKEAYICELLHSYGLPAPTVLTLDTTCSLLPAPFIIQAGSGGQHLGDLILSVGSQDRLEVYCALGLFYRRLHDIHFPHSGWIEKAGIVYPFSPNRHQYEEVIIKVGGEAVSRGLLRASTHACLKKLWGSHLDWLDQHQPSLVSGGALHWAVYLEKSAGWQVTKVTDLHDMLYWDPAWDLASIRYPVFMPELPSDLWEAFTLTYGLVPEDKRMRLYALMQHLDAAMGNYMEPSSLEHNRWKAAVWKKYDGMIEAAERV